MIAAARHRLVHRLVPRLVHGLVHHLLTGLRNGRRGRIRATLAVAGILGLGGVSTLAAWTDQATATSGSFSAGRIDLKLGNPAVDDNPPAFTSTFTLSAMKPGDSTTATLLVSNAGSIPLTYTIAGTATNIGAGTDQLGAAMALQIYAGSSCSGTVLNSVEKFTFAATTARPLASGANETLCFKATLPSAAASALQGTTTTATFTFVATST